MAVRQVFHDNRSLHKLMVRVKRTDQSVGAFF